MPKSETVHFCPICGHSFSGAGVLADGGHDCKGATAELTAEQWRAAVVKTRAIITPAGRLALSQNQEQSE